MKLLLTNDDGIRAPGIIALYDALQGATFAGRRIEAIRVVAPMTVQSATSHGITFHEPLMTRQVRASPTLTGTAVDGRPADCTKLALTNLWKEWYGPDARPDLVVSGMNMGANCGINVLYSGTVAAAVEAAFLGVPSVAVSLHLGGGKADYALAARHAVHALETLLAAGLPEPHECVNVNIPRCEEGEPGHEATPELAVVPMNVHGIVDAYERRLSPAGEPYYWATGHGLDFVTTDPDTDVSELLNRRRITVTPLRYDLTEHGKLAKWRERAKG